MEGASLHKYLCALTRDSPTGWACCRQLLNSGATPAGGDIGVVHIAVQVGIGSWVAASTFRSPRQTAQSRGVGIPSLGDKEPVALGDRWHPLLVDSRGSESGPLLARQPPFRRINTKRKLS